MAMQAATHKPVAEAAARVTVELEPWELPIAIMLMVVLAEVALVVESLFCCMVAPTLIAGLSK